MASWYARRRQQSVRAALPSAWRYGGPTSDTAHGSTSLTAAAVRVATDEKVKRGDNAHNGDEQELWAMYNQVGELRYVANAIAGRMGQAELYVEKNGVRQDEDDPILELITPQMIERLGLNIFMIGGAYLAGLPEKPGAVAVEDGITPEGAKKTKWLVLSTLEVTRKGKGDKIKVMIRDEEYLLKDIYLEKIWDPHPAMWEEMDSPVRSALPVLRELVGLTQHVSAQIDSRLAGAGIYWIPNSILSSAKVPTVEGQTTFSDNPVLNAIMNAMLLPIEDRSNASAVVPALFGAPDDSIAKIRYDTFSTPFDKNTKDLRDESIRRLALNLDAPPELLLGMGDSNHWAAWLVRDEVVQIHVAPRLELITDALTTGFYRPIKKQQDPDADVDEYVVKADVSGLVQRPNRLADASQLHAVEAVGLKALREAGGYDDEDAPSSDELAVKYAIQVATGNPQLLDNMPEIVAALKAVLDGSPETGPTTIQSQREPGTLKPLVPANKGKGSVAPPIRKEAKPLAEADSLPDAGSPV